jgi:hypothetical protein
MRWPPACQANRTLIFRLYRVARPVSSDRSKSLYEAILERNDATTQRFREADHPPRLLTPPVLPQAEFGALRARCVVASLR